MPCRSHGLGTGGPQLPDQGDAYHVIHRRRGRSVSGLDWIHLPRNGECDQATNAGKGVDAISTATPETNVQLVNKPLLVAIVYVGVFGSQTASLMLPPFLVSIAEQFEISVAIAGQLATATFAAWAASVILSGPLSDSFGRRPVALIGLSLMAGATLACAFSPSIYILLALRAITGLGGGMIPPNSAAILADVISPERRAQALGGLLGVNSLTGAISVLLLVPLADLLGWRYAFVASGLLLAAAFILNFIWFPSGIGQRIRGFSFLSRYRALLSMGFFRTAIFVMATNRVAYWAMVTYLPAFLDKTYGLSLAAVAAPVAIAAACQVVGSYSAGYVARRGNRTVLVGVTTLAGGILGLVFFAIPLDLWVAVAVVSIGTGLLSITAPTLISMSTEYSGQSRATGIGLMGLGNQLGGVGGAAFGGALLASTQFAGIGYLCLGVTVASALVAGFLMRRQT